MTERLCLRDCVRKGEHYAACESWTNPDHTCPGCVPWEAAHGSLLCPKCIGRMKYLLNNIGDLHGRLTAKADPLTASPLDQIRVRASTTDLPAAADADLLDALHVVTTALAWANTDVTDETNNRDTATYLGALLLDRHKPVNGIREAWSVQDAIDTWGIERRTDTHIYPEADEDELEERNPVTEWFDPMLTKTEAERAAGSARTLRRWVEKGLIQPHGRLINAGTITPWYRASEIQALKEQMQERITRNQYAKEEA